VLATGEQWVQGHVLERSTDEAAHLGTLMGDVEASHARAAGGRGQQGGEHEHGRRLAGAVGPQEAVDLARRDVEVDAVDRPHVLELAHEPLDLDAPGLVHGRRG